MQEKRYGLLTAITMITGIVIGSGIFFKSDDVLRYTNGNMLLGIFVFLVAAIAIVFGSLTISQLASRTDEPGGLIGYAEKFVNKRTAGAIGWFQLTMYFAPLVGVVSWVTGLYFCQLFGIESTPTNSSLIGFIVLSIIFLLNILSARLGGAFQNLAMIVKLIPLLVIAVVGLLFGQAPEIIAKDASVMNEAIASPGWIAAFAPIAFSFDGWSISTTICHEIKNSKRNLPLALIIAPLMVLLCYVLYFVGITSLISVDTVMQQGNESTYLAATKVFGSIGARLILIFVIISVLGTLNGLVLAYIQLPYSLAYRGMLPYSSVLKKQSAKLHGIPIYSAILAFVLSAIWVFINYLTQNANMIGDVSEVPICLSYVMFIILYITVIKLKRQGEIKSVFMGYVAPLLAIVGSLIILTGTLSHPSFWFFTVIGLIVVVCGYCYTKSSCNSQEG